MSLLRQLAFRLTLPESVLRFTTTTFCHSSLSFSGTPPFTLHSSGTPGTDASEASRFPDPSPCWPCLEFYAEPVAVREAGLSDVALAKADSKMKCGVLVNPRRTLRPSRENWILTAYWDCKRFRRPLSVNNGALAYFPRPSYQKLSEIEEPHPERDATLRRIENPDAAMTS